MNIFEDLNDQQIVSMMNAESVRTGGFNLSITTEGIKNQIIDLLCENSESSTKLAIILAQGFDELDSLGVDYGTVWKHLKKHGA